MSTEVLNIAWKSWKRNSLKNGVQKMHKHKTAFGGLFLFGLRQFELSDSIKT